MSPFEYALIAIGVVAVLVFAYKKSGLHVTPDSIKAIEDNAKERFRGLEDRVHELARNAPPQGSPTTVAPPAPPVIVVNVPPAPPAPVDPSAAYWARFGGGAVPGAAAILDERFANQPARDWSYKLRPNLVLNDQQWLFALLDSRESVASKTFVCPGGQIKLCGGGQTCGAGSCGPNTPTYNYEPGYGIKVWVTDEGGNRVAEGEFGGTEWDLSGNLPAGVLTVYFSTANANRSAITVEAHTGSAAGAVAPGATVR